LPFVPPPFVFPLFLFIYNLEVVALVAPFFFGLKKNCITL